YQTSAKLKLVELRRLPDGRIEEVVPPASLPSNAVTVLDVYGSLFYAGAYMFERALPSARDASRAVVVLRMRGQSNIGITFINCLARYAEQLSTADGRLYLSGLSKTVEAQLKRTDKVGVFGPFSAYRATTIVGESSEHALQDAEAWLIEHSPESGIVAPADADTPP
ncbi:MAG TPA: STAS domain-containing protein, partial [Thermomicrobiales bacterium]|nr:STAS domain-containing protein [Thermomicrobiales bacterium]